MKNAKKALKNNNHAHGYEFNFGPILYAPTKELLSLPPRPRSLKASGKGFFLVRIIKYLHDAFLRASRKISKVYVGIPRGFYDYKEQRCFLLERQKNDALIKFYARRF